MNRFLLSGRRRPFPAIALLAIAPGCAAPASRPEERAAAPPPAPLLVLIERNPWLLVIGSDSPTFALYQDGSVILVDPDSPPDGGDKRYVSSRLSFPALQRFLQSAGVESLLSLEDFYELTRATDQPANEIHLWKGRERKSVVVYGPLRGWRELPEESRPENPPPPAFEKVFELVTTFRPENYSPWLPEQIEVLIWPFEHSPPEPLAWPEDWPSLEQSQALSESLHQIFLPRSEFPRLRAFLESLGEGQAVLLGGRKWSVSYRIPFPSESAWMPSQPQEG